MRKTALRGAFAAGIAVALAAVIVGVSSCSSPLLTRVKQEIAKYPFTASSYRFVRQWGNAHPEWSFYNPIVKADTSGYVYVADRSFRIRKFSSGGVLQSTIGLVSSKGISASLSDLAFDASGNMYVATGETNQIQKYNAAGSKILDWGGSTVFGTATLFANSAPSGIAVDGNGYVYVVDASNTRVVKFDSTGVFQTEWGGTTTFGGATFSNPQGIAVDRSNSIYVVDNGNHRVVKFNSSGVFQTEWGRLGTDLYPPAVPGPSGPTLIGPTGISVSLGNTQYAYVVDYGNSRIVEFSTNGSYLTTWGSSGITNGLFSFPNSVAVDTSGSVYVSDNAGFWGRVQKFNNVIPPAYKETWVLDSTLSDGIFNLPWGIAFDRNGNTYINDYLNGRVQKFDASGNFMAKAMSQGTTALFLAPMGIAVDATNNVYVLEQSGNRIQKFDSSLNYLTTWGSAGNGQKQFSGPTALAVAASGNIYIADLGNHRVQVLDSSGNFLRMWGSISTNPPSDGQFGNIYGIAVDSSENVYVSDMTLHRIQKFDSLGTFLAKWEYQGTGDGQFVNPLGLAVDAIGNVYVADLGNHRFDKFDSSGHFLAKVGGAGAGAGGFGWPVAIAVNSTGQVVVSDYMGNLVQEFEPAQ